MTVQRFGKRVLDLAIAAVGLLLLAIPFGVIAGAIKLEDRGRVFFRQERIGKDGQPFRVWKFRSMEEGAQERGLGVTMSKDDSRITKTGRRLRDWGLDELPQLLNVLFGQMSLVGPRPTLAYQVAEYDDFQRRRLEVAPGITSLAVISGRNALPWKRRIEFDVEYIDRWSLWLDAKILLKTLWVVLVKRQGLYGEDGINDTFIPLDEDSKTGDA